MQIPQKWTTLNCKESTKVNSILQIIRIPHSLCYSWHVYIKWRLLQVIFKREQEFLF